MKRVSFSFIPGSLEQYRALVPQYRSSYLLQHYLLNEYRLPDILECLQENVTNVEVEPIWLSEESIQKIDLLVGEALNKGVVITKSSIIRDIISQLISKYTKNPISPSEQKAQAFKVPKGTKQTLNKLIGEKVRTYEVANFIMNNYVPSNEFPSIRGQETEDFFLMTDIEVFNKMDQLVEEYGLKNGRTKIFRDVIKQFINSFGSNASEKSKLQHELKKVILEYKKIEDPEVIKGQVNEYLK
ncbi:hypothetical protein NSQ59_27145 [Margalitia sp. FSL K6-0131]|uniref:hypothetical protein n=1 Tax=Margalitia sp. FSL K6-0131 TaxID=2954604 RepID=UPI0030FA3048